MIDIAHTMIVCCKLKMLLIITVVFCLSVNRAVSLSNQEEYPYHVTLTLSTWTQLFMNSTRKNQTLNVYNITQNVTFLIIQAHSFRDSVTLASVENPKFGQYVTSPDAGMTSLLTPGQMNITWYLSTEAERNVTVYIYVTPYNEYDPVPGACNQEFPLEYDPNIHLSHDPNIGTMVFQYSNVGFPRAATSDLQPGCESQWDLLSYDIYIHYMSSVNPSGNEHFLAMERMTHPDNIVKYGRKMLTIERGRGMRPKADFMAYPGQGVIYNVIVTQTEGTLVRRSAYIPSTSYSCSLLPGQPNNCDTLDDRTHPYKAIATAIACFGCLLMLFAHKFLKCNMFSFGFLSFTLLSYIIFCLNVNMDPMNLFWIAAAIGLLGGLLWVGFWWCLGIPVLSVLLIGLTAGYLLASVIFYTPFDDWNIFRQEFNYGMIFACWVMFFNLLVLPWPKRVSILSSSLVGSYSIVVAAGLYVRSSVPYILINSVRKAVIPNFIQAIPTKPYFPEDTILLVTWVIVFAVSASYQFYSTRYDVDFPPCPRTERVIDQNRSMLAEESANNDDLQGLLSQVSYPSYDALDDSDSTGILNPGYGNTSRGSTAPSRPLPTAVGSNRIA